MFREKEMATAIYSLFDFFEEEDYEDFESDFLIGEVGEQMHEICLALRNEVVVPYEYSVNNFTGIEFSYRGKELFGKRACLLVDVPQDDASGPVSSAIDKELWLLEDMSFAIVSCVRSGLCDQTLIYGCEYRSIVTTEPERDDLFFSPEVLAQSLEWAVERYEENSATVYEM